MDLDDVIGISLGDNRREVWSEILMTPELKANKMSLNRKVCPCVQTGRYYNCTFQAQSYTRSFKVVTPFA